MKAKNIFLTLTIITAVLFATAAQAGGTGSKPPKPVKKGPPPKPVKPSKPVCKPRALLPTQYSGSAVGVDLSNIMTHAVWHVADTGQLPSTGGSLDVSVGETSVDSLFVGGARVTSSGVGGLATSTAFVTNFSAVFVHMGITNVITFSSAWSITRAECTATGVMIAASSGVEGLTIDGTNVVINSDLNQVIHLPVGDIVFNVPVGSVSDNGQYGEVSIAAIYLMFTDCFNGAIAFSESDIRCGSKVPPETRACDKVTGGGFILGTPSGAHGSFAVGGGIRRGQFWGHLNYIDHGTGMHVHATAVTGFSVIDSVTRQIDYNVIIDGAAGTARVIVADNGEPGRNDIFDITLSTGYHAGGDLGGTGHGGGNIQLHKCPPGWAK
ncbi:MAG TPA: choice-of-anchor P family protein [Verrucomicrobiae bacterium]|nr:choice-of-anchor P family protein [Verrucomicrobiae bacterium]